ncbi:MAG: hypothetical protein SFT92_01810 [Rickettsiales bacterium]|nr:hypothetical protein [Rickettsiales bacterium]
MFEEPEEFNAPEEFKLQEPFEPLYDRYVQLLIEDKRLDQIVLDMASHLSQDNSRLNVHLDRIQAVMQKTKEAIADVKAQMGLGFKKRDEFEIVRAVMKEDAYHNQDNKYDFEDVLKIAEMDARSFYEQRIEQEQKEKRPGRVLSNLLERIDHRLVLSLVKAHESYDEIMVDKIDGRIRGELLDLGYKGLDWDEAMLKLHAYAKSHAKPKSRAPTQAKSDTFAARIDDEDMNPGDHDFRWK